MVFNEYFSCIEGVSFIDGGNRVPGENYDLIGLWTEDNDLKHSGSISI
jgi:hypothetical protein